jgi:hypothetical protein
VSSDGKQSPEKKPESGPKKRSRNGRMLFYGGLFLFVVAAVASVVVFPTLRLRLIQRTETLYAAIRGTRGPVVADIGDRQSAYPDEYKRPEPAVLNAGQTLPKDWMFRVPSEPSKSSQPSKSGNAGVGSGSALIEPKVEDMTIASSGNAATGKKPAKENSGNSGSDSGMQYTTGKEESDAYALLLEKYPKVAEMVKGSDASLKFRSWGGARREEGIYWVRVIFETGGDSEVYIWQVDLRSGQVVPLSYNARSLS